MRNIDPRAWAVAFVVVFCLNSIHGCASYDELRCGKGYVLRDGLCQGFGDGFTYERKVPRPLL